MPLVRLAACLGVAACSYQDDPSSSEASAFTTSPADLKQAAADLLNPPPTVSSPDAKVEGAIYRATRLNELFAPGQVSSEWQHSKEDRFVLAERGPVSSKRTAASDVHVEDKRGMGGHHYRWLIFDEVDIERQQIGQIFLRGDFGDSDYFVLTWPGYSGLRFELDKDRAVQEFLISTENFLKWRGTLGRLEIGIPVSSAPQDELEIHIESLRLIDRQASFPDPAGVREVRIGRVLRTALYGHGGSRFHLGPVEAAEGDAFTAFVATASDPVELAIRVRGRDTSRLLFSGRVANKDTWRPVNDVSLEGLVGELTLEFHVRGAPESVVLVGSPTLYSPQKAPPRVILYLIDTLSARRMSLYGYDRDTTPNLARIARQGTWFPNSFSTGPWTPETVPSLLTSLYTPSHGLTDQYARLGNEFFTLAEAFAAAGYATVAFSTNGNAGPTRGTAQGFDAFFDHIAMGQDAEAQLTVPVDEALAWLEHHRDRPIFMYVHTAEPHDPYDPPEIYRQRFAGDYDGPVGREWPARNNLVHKHKGVSLADRQQLSSLYDADIAYADAMFATFWDALEQREFLNNTLLAVTSDHGEEFGEHGIYGHGSTLYDQLIRVPLLLWGPEFFTAIEPPQANVNLLDIMPTLLELTGIRTSAPLQGWSLAELVRGKGRSQRDFIDRSILATGHIIGRGPKYAIIAGNWKLVLWTAGGEFEKLELYDLAADPFEQDNLVAERSELAGELLSQLVESYAGLPAYAAPTGTSEPQKVSREQLERLRALGYLE